jgi:hypothetical protein
VAFVKALHGDEFRAVHPATPGDDEITERTWAVFSRSRVPLDTIPGNGRRVREFLRYVRSVPTVPGGVVTVVIPELLTGRSLFRAVRRGPAFALKVRLLGEPGVVVMDVPLLATPAARASDAGPIGLAAMRPRRTEAIVLVSSVNDATIRAIAYARSQRVDTVRALCCVMDRRDVQHVWDDWIEHRIPIELSFVDAPFRDLGAPILDEVRAVTAAGHGVAIVVLPELVVPTLRHELLHNQRALYIKRLLLFEPNVVLTSVPYALAGPEPKRRRLPRRRRPWFGGESRDPEPMAVPANQPGGPVPARPLEPVGQASVERPRAGPAH